MFCKVSETTRLAGLPEFSSGLLGAPGACQAVLPGLLGVLWACQGVLPDLLGALLAVLLALWAAFGHFWAALGCIWGGPKCLAHRQGRCKTYFCKNTLQAGLCPPKLLQLSSFWSSVVPFGPSCLPPGLPLDHPAKSYRQRHL